MAHNMTIKPDLAIHLYSSFCYFICKSSILYHEKEICSETSVDSSKVRKGKSIGPLSFG